MKAISVVTGAKNSIIKDARLLINVIIEFLRGFFVFERIGPAITVFGSARFHENHPIYEEARKLGSKIAEAGFAVVTGGGPGIMEAANRGAKEANGKSIGANIIIPREQGANKYLDRVVTFNYFFVRKFMLIRYSHAFVVFPGGYGTLDEAMEALTLLQTGKLRGMPVIFVGREYWSGFLEWLRSTVLKSGAISSLSLDLLSVTDDHEEVLNIIKGRVDGN